MALTFSPYGLRPVNMLGGAPYSGARREIRLSTNNGAAISTGDIIQLTAAGNPQAIASSPVAGTTSGIVGVCVGIRFVDAAQRLPVWTQRLPANAITAGATDVWVSVVDDPNVVFQVQGANAFGTLTNGAHGAIGKNLNVANFGSNAATGLSTVNAVVGVNGASLAATATLPFRIVGVVEGTELHAFPELLVKFNGATHSYNFATGV